VATSNPDLPPEVGTPSLTFTKARRFRFLNRQGRRDSIRRSYRWLALVLEFGLISAAYGGAKETDSSAAGGIDPGATLTLGSVITLRIWNPHLAFAPGAAYELLTPVYDRLLLAEPDLSVGPMLAKSYELSADHRSMTLHLRNDVTFSDGTPFNADVVKANIDYTKVQKNSAAETAKIVKDVAILDPYTVRLDFNADGTNFPLILAYDFIIGAMVSPKALLDPKTLFTTPNGSGPYRLVQSTTAQVTYEKVPNYWDKMVSSHLPQRLVLVTIANDNARLAALRSGQIDGMAVAGPISEIKALTADGKIKLSTFSNTRILNVYVNFSNPMLAKPEVRRALSLAIDRNAIASQVELGTATAAVQPASKRDAVYNPGVQILYDPKKAQSLLAAAAGTSSLTLKMMVVAAEPYESIATVLQAQWAAIGVKVQITPVHSALAAIEWPKGRYDLWMGTAQGEPDEALMMAQAFTGSGRMPFGTDPELASMDNAASILPLRSPQREKAYQKINGYVAENPVIIIIATWPMQLLTTKCVVGVNNVSFTQLLTVWDTRPLSKLRNCGSSQ
jgi:ABC-type transport system substrate-binding protein